MNIALVIIGALFLTSCGPQETRDLEDVDIIGSNDQAGIFNSGIAEEFYLEHPAAAVRPGLQIKLHEVWASKTGGCSELSLIYENSKPKWQNVHSREKIATVKLEKSAEYRCFVMIVSNQLKARFEGETCSSSQKKAHKLCYDGRKVILPNQVGAHSIQSCQQKLEKVPLYFSTWAVGDPSVSGHTETLPPTQYDDLFQGAPLQDEVVIKENTKLELIFDTYSQSAEQLDCRLERPKLALRVR